jgi:hypothetical protein
MDASGMIALHQLVLLNQSVATKWMFHTGVQIHVLMNAQNHSSQAISAIQLMNMLEICLLVILNGNCA